MEKFGVFVNVGGNNMFGPLHIESKNAERKYKKKTSITLVPLLREKSSHFN